MHLLPRVQIRLASVLERTADGTLMLAQEGAKPVCVLPNGIKFDKNPQLTPAQAADQALLIVASQSSGQLTEIPALKSGTQVFFVASPDVELAEFLRAQRASSVTLWQDYLKRYPASGHSVQARQGLAALLLQSAESTLGEYSRTAHGESPRLGLLKQARTHASQAEALTGNHAAADKIRQQLHAQLDLLLEKNRRQLQSSPGPLPSTQLDTSI